MPSRLPLKLVLTFALAITFSAVIITNLNVSLSASSSKSQFRYAAAQIQTVVLNDTGEDGELVKANSEEEKTAACRRSKLHNFFTDIQSSFKDIDIGKDGIFNIQRFVESSEECTRLFTALGSLAFKPVIDDYTGNLQRIRERLRKSATGGGDSEHFTIDVILLEDKKNGVEFKSDSTTQSILWLSRSLWFLSALMDNMIARVKFQTSVQNAYYATIRRYHGFSVKAVFAMITPLLPTTEQADTSLSVNGEYSTNTDLYKSCLYNDMDVYNQALKRILRAVHNYYQRQNIVVIDGQI